MFHLGFRPVFLALIVVVFAAGAGAARAEGRQVEADAMRALVTELQQLRVAIQNLVTANSRVQVLSLRASQYEQRLSSISEQLLTMRTMLFGASMEASSTAARLQELDESLRLEVDPERRQLLEEQRREVLQRVEETRLRQATIQAEVDRLTSQSTLEQSRLDDIHRRLDELERSLAVPSQ